jgi:tripartite-type tricarboxylate transporter receptor subunit TctC
MDQDFGESEGDAMRDRWLAKLALVIGFTAAVMVGGTAPAAAADGRYPTRAVDVIVPQAAGGAGDTWVRIIMPYVSKKWGVPINVVNRPGGSSVPGVMAVLSAAADGYTILYDGAVTPSQTAVMINSPFKWDDPLPIAKMVSAPLAFAVKTDSPWKTLKEALDAVRADPGSVKCGVGGAAAPGVFGLAKLFDAAGIDPRRPARVIFEGSTPTMAALAGGHVTLTSQPLPDALALSQAGKIRVLAVSSSKRSPAMPDVPTGSEAGFPAYDLGTWGAISGPPRLPEHIVKAWADALKEALQDPGVVEKLAARQTFPDFRGPAEHKQFLEGEYKLKLGIAERLGLRK